MKYSLFIGRWQPWHKGHRALFCSALEKAERVAIGVRATFATDGKNPFSFEEVKKFISCKWCNRTIFNSKYSLIRHVKE